MRLAEIAHGMTGWEGEPRTSGPPTARRILIVEDNVDAAESLALLLGLRGHETLTAGDGPRALAAAETFRPDIAFIDIGLPGMDGHEVARQMRMRPDLRATLLVALTGHGAPEDRQRSQAAGFDRHMVKPIDLGELDRVLSGLRIP